MAGLHRPRAGVSGNRHRTVKEGVIKYRLFHIAGPCAPPPPKAFFSFRQWLYEKKWIGQAADGLGYGNWSMRAPLPDWGTDAFYITASQTSHLPAIDADEVALVTYYSIEENYLYCRGALPASSEALSHAALYAAFADVGCAAHIHHRAAWEGLKGAVPTTDAAIAYGTPAMARAIQEAASDAGVIVMGGHPEGLLFWERTPEALQERMQAIMAPFS